MLHVTCETKTMDNVLVTVEVAVQYRVPDAEAARLFFYSLTEPEAQMDAIIHDTIRSLVPKFSLDDLFRSENGVSVALSEQLGISFGEFGVEVKASPVTSINFADEVKEANNRIQTMQRLRMAASDEAEGKFFPIIFPNVCLKPSACSARLTRGELHIFLLWLTLRLCPSLVRSTRAAAAIKHMKWANATAAAAQIRATADADVCHLRGVGVARQRAAMLDGMKAGLAKWEDVDGLDNKYVLAVMMQGQYVSAMQAIGEGDGSNTIFVPSSADESSNLTQTLRETIFCGEATKKAMNPSSV